MLIHYYIPPPRKCKWHKQEASMQAHLWLKVAIPVATIVAEAAVVAMQGFVGHALMAMEYCACGDRGFVRQAREIHG
jgi:hypothetical protein